MKILGVNLDERLNFIDHVKEAKKVAIARLTKLELLGTSSVNGVGIEAYRTAFQACVKPMFLYCCAVWFRPENQANGATQAYDVIQSKALRLATGAFRRTSKGSLEVVNNTLPARQTLHKQVLDSLLRMAGRDPGRTLIAEADTAATPVSPLAQLKRFALKVGGPSILDVEYCTAFVCPPWNFLPTTIAPDDAEEAVDIHNEALHLPGLHIYTDGSRHQGPGRLGSGLPRNQRNPRIPPRILRETYGLLRRGPHSHSRYRASGRLGILLPGPHLHRQQRSGASRLKPDGQVRSTVLPPDYLGTAVPGPHHDLLDPLPH